jgi:hypothetical protein
LLPTFRYFTKAAGLVQEYADYVRLPYYPGPCHLDEFTALFHQVTPARDHLSKLLLDQRQMDDALRAS